MNVQKGFTLIELMIVVAIIGILAAIAIPEYEQYVVRSQVTEGMSLAAAIKAGIVEQHAQTGDWPADLKAIGLDPAIPPSGKYAKSVQLVAGVIVITYGVDANDQISKLSGNVLAIAPGQTASGSIVWVCGYAPKPADQGGATTWAGDPSGLTTIPAKYLPSSCRS